MSGCRSARWDVRAYPVVAIMGVALATGLAGTLTGCATQCQENFSLLKPGMSKAQVEDLLGKPSSRWPSQRPGEEGTEHWQYGDNLSSLTTTGVFKEPDSSRVFVVWFDANGNLTSYSEPDWTRER
jgi:SmpA / OmlA family